MNINQIKGYLLSKTGSRIVVLYYGSRNRCEKYDGFLVRVYNNIFTIRVKTNEIKSFSYIDILTKTIQIYI